MLEINVKGAYDVFTEGRCIGLRIPSGNDRGEIHCRLIKRDGSEKNSIYYFTDVDELGIHNERRFKYSLLIEKVRQ